ncbi:MAG: TrmH family RNA methyltransferase, partial [Pseudomonadota bacterium]|nr:TrmH family RNA methyltransferase [Pseudomonadota bacterium]MEC7550384.1 TrmH family RNA methyltransferase [Pseudomonadota bacterium]
MNTIPHIKIVLVNTSHPGNIGATARAMKNMGLTRLALVNPMEFPSGVAVGRAASALDVLERAEVVETLVEAIADCALVIGSSA